MTRMRIMGALAALAFLGACVWTADDPLIPTEAADMSPIPAGDYVDQDGTLTLRFGQPTQSHVRVTSYGESRSNTYSVRFDRIDSEFYLAEVIVVEGENPGAVAFVLVRATSGGFERWTPSCNDFDDRPIALSAGARLDGANDPVCVFSSYASLANAARGLVGYVRADEWAIASSSYTRR